MRKKETYNENKRVLDKQFGLIEDVVFEFKWSMVQMVLSPIIIFYKQKKNYVRNKMHILPLVALCGSASVSLYL